jgi:hypothetical protein
VHEARGSAIVTLSKTDQSYPLSGTAYTQAADEVDSFSGALDVTFAAACGLPRSVDARLVLDAADPLAPEPYEVVAAGSFSESTGGGTVSRRIELSPTATRFEPGTAKSHTMTLIANGICFGGSGITANFGAVDVIGTK